MSLKDKLSETSSESDTQVSNKKIAPQAPIPPAENASREEKEADLAYINEALTMLTCLMESTLIQKEANNEYSSQPIDHFYFCSQNALTIGYGNKIECNGNEICKEGLEILKLLDIKDEKGVSLSQKEKEARVKECIANRNKRDKLAGKNKASAIKTDNGCISASTRTCRMNPRAQKLVLFDKGKFCTIDKESALRAMRYEMQKKIKKLKDKNPNTEDSYFSKALLADFAYQFGDTGVRQLKFYKNVKAGTFPDTLNYSKKSVKKDRSALRELMCKMACKAHKNKKPLSQENQARFCLEALKEFAGSYKTGINCKEKHKIVLMENFMTIAFMQSMRDGKGAELTVEEVKNAQIQAHDLVYNSIFNNELLQQLPEGLRPQIILSALQKLSVSPDQTVRFPEYVAQAVQERMFQSTQKIVAAYNKEHGTDIQLVSAPNVPSSTNELCPPNVPTRNSVNDVPDQLQASIQKERW